MSRGLRTACCAGCGDSLPESQPPGEVYCAGCRAESEIARQPNPPVVEDDTGRRAPCIHMPRFGYLCGLCHRGWPKPWPGSKCSHCGAVVIEAKEAGGAR